MRLVHAAARKRDRAHFPQQLCAALCRGLPVEEVSLCLSTSPASQQVLGTCGAAALCLEEVQFETGEGPGTDAVATGRPVLYPDLRTQPMPYPFFAPRLQEEATHVAAVYAFPLTLGTHTFGTAQCVRFDPLRLNALALAQAAAAMDAAAGLVADFCLPHFAADDTLPWSPPRPSTRTGAPPTGPPECWPTSWILPSPTPSRACAPWPSPPVVRCPPWLTTSCTTDVGLRATTVPPDGCRSSHLG